MEYICQEENMAATNKIKTKNSIDIIYMFFSYIMILFIILSESSMYIALQNGIDFNTLRLIVLASAVVLAIGCLLTKRYCILKRNILKLFAIIGYLTLFSLFNDFNAKYYFIHFMIPLIVFGLYHTIRYKENILFEFMEKYTNIVVFLAGMSLIFYFGGVVFNLIPGNPIQYFNLNRWNSGVSFFNLHFVNNYQTQNVFGYNFIRNVGVFMEAPGFAFPLTIALYYELFTNHTKKRFRIIILIVAMVTTFSTKALILGAVVLMYYMIFASDKSKKIIKAIRLLLIPILSIAAVVFIYYILITKTQGENSTSFLRRFDDTQAALKTWLQYPLFGAGYENIYAIYYNFKYSSYEGGVTAGLFNILAYGGIYMFLFYMIGIINGIKFYYKENKIFVIGFFLLYLTFLFMSSMQFGYFTLFLLALCWFL